jgi:RND family efflux transporter MFP subunit
VADIAAKRDVTEAKARYETALKNKQLFDANVGRSAGSSKLISLSSPISGVVGTFNYAIGAVVNTGETLFEVTNLNNVYVEAQVFTGNLKDAKEAARFTVSPSKDTTVFSLKMLSTAQAVNTQNQSQTVLFQIINPAGRFKIGEAVKVRMYLNKRVRQVVVPNEAITEVNGKPAVFIKDKAEQFTISYIAKGESNGSVTAISKGVEEGEKIVTTNVYQMKMIFLNQ